MAELSREERISAAFITLADTLVDDYDVVDLLDTLVRECTALVNSDAGGLLIADPSGTLQLVASTSEDAEFVEINQLNAGEGPCVEAFTTGKSVAVSDLNTLHDRWPVFQTAAAEQGFRSVQAFPMRLRGQTIGAMNLFSTTTGDLSGLDSSLAQALADVATIGLLQERALRDSELLSSQLQRALESRVVIEQAKGVIAAQTGEGMHAAFVALRTYSRAHRLKLSAVAQEVTELTLVLSPSGEIAEDSAS